MKLTPSQIWNSGRASLTISVSALWSRLNCGGLHPDRNTVSDIHRYADQQGHANQTLSDTTSPIPTQPTVHIQPTPPSMIPTTAAVSLVTATRLACAFSIATTSLYTAQVYTAFSTTTALLALPSLPRRTARVRSLVSRGPRVTWWCTHSALLAPRT